MQKQGYRSRISIASNIQRLRVQRRKKERTVTIRLGISILFSVGVLVVGVTPFSPIHFICLLIAGCFLAAALARSDDDSA